MRKKLPFPVSEEALDLTEEVAALLGDDKEIRKELDRIADEATELEEESATDVLSNGLCIFVAEYLRDLAGGPLEAGEAADTCAVLRALLTEAEVVTKRKKRKKR